MQLLLNLLFLLDLNCSNPAYVQLGAKCYRTVLEGGLSYGKAQATCARDGGHLAVMTTEEEVISVFASIQLVSRPAVIFSSTDVHLIPRRRRGRC
jgi:hypothetical protein